MNLKHALLISGIVLASITGGCAREPGPAERIGRSLDELSRGVRDLGDDWDQNTESERQRAVEATPTPRYRDDSYSGKDHSYDYPDHDPYYDSPPSDSDRAGESDYERRERERRDPNYRPERY